MAVDSVTVIYRLQKGLERRIQSLAINVTSGGVDNMETYKYITGQIHALESVRQEISNLLNDKEQNDTKGTIVDLNPRSTKN
jgi:hypothetical protein|tara:strand:+ start:420 stop:665 length:246 start_codon:yes stop_codon:yes gene_type:complete